MNAFSIAFDSLSNMPSLFVTFWNKAKRLWGIHRHTEGDQSLYLGSFFQFMKEDWKERNQLLNYTKRKIMNNWKNLDLKFASKRNKWKESERKLESACSDFLLDLKFDSLFTGEGFFVRKTQWEVVLFEVALLDLHFEWTGKRQMAVTEVLLSILTLACLKDLWLHWPKEIKKKGYKKNG